MQMGYRTYLDSMAAEIARSSSATPSRTIVQAMGNQRVLDYSVPLEGDLGIIRGMG
jgi:hypothetical protein